MKIFYKKDYFRVLDELNSIKGELKEEQEQKEFVIDKLKQEERANQTCLKTIEDMHYKMQDLKKKIKQLKGARGGFTKEINKLKNQKEELEKKLAESMTNKYLVRKIKPGKKPNTLKMAVKNSSSVQSNIVKNMHRG